MPSIKDFVQDEATYTDGLGEDRLKIVYSPKSMTPGLTQRMLQMIEDGDTLATARLLCGDIIKSWNLEGPLEGMRVKTDEHGDEVRDEDDRLIYERYEAVRAGEVIPLDPEIVQFLTNSHINWIWQALSQDAQSVENPFRHKGRARPKRR